MEDQIHLNCKPQLHSKFGFYNTEGKSSDYKWSSSFFLHYEYMLMITIGVKKGQNTNLFYHVQKGKSYYH